MLLGALWLGRAGYDMATCRALSFAWSGLSTTFELCQFLVFPRMLEYSYAAQVRVLTRL